MGLNEQFHGAFTSNTAARLMYPMSINETAQPQGPSFFMMIGQGDWLFSQPPIMQPQTTGKYTVDQMTAYAGSTQSYGEQCSYGGGSSTAQHEIRPSQNDQSPPITQLTQRYEHIDFSGVEETRRPPTGARKKGRGKKKVTGTSWNMCEVDDE
uniref:Uncharacterized protein n=1 Tax=Oryza punctata TaxID=4537 RepID=A0A0E0KNB5_ORYPU